MKISKSGKILLAFQLLVVFILESSFGQQPGIKDLGTDEMQVKGRIIALGQVMEPPYEIVIKNGTILINNSTFYPRSTKSSLILNKNNISKEYELRRNIEEQITNEYRENKDSLDKKSNIEKIITKFNKDESINSLSWLPEEETLRIEYWDGYVEYLELLETKGKVSAYERESVLLRKKELVMFALKQGYSIAFGSEYTLYIHNEKMKAIFETLEKLNSNTISKTDAINIVDGICNNSDFTTDFISGGTNNVK